MDRNGGGAGRGYWIGILFLFCFVVTLVELGNADPLSKLINRPGVAGAVL